MRLPVLLRLSCVLMGCGCATPSPGMLGATRHDIRLNGMAFIVFHKDERAEVVRRDFVARPSAATIRPLMEEAAARTTGCAVIPFSDRARVPRETGVVGYDLDCQGILSLRPES